MINTFIFLIIKINSLIFTFFIKEDFRLRKYHWLSTKWLSKWLNKENKDLFHILLQFLLFWYVFESLYLTLVSEPLCVYFLELQNTYCCAFLFLIYMCFMGYVYDCFTFLSQWIISPIHVYASSFYGCLLVFLISVHNGFKVEMPK